MSKYLKLFFSFFLFSSLYSVAHEFWIAPNKYIIRKNEPFSFNCYVGEDFQPTIWAKRRKRTLKVKKYHLSASSNITPNFIEKDSLNILMSLNETGNYLISLSSKPTYIEMEGTAFNEYLKEDGMLNILAYRKTNNKDQQRSKELYQRCAKSLLQVDGKNDDTYKNNTGMILEIIPLTNPYEIKNNSLPVYFEFKGNPLSNYQVRTWCKQNGKLTVKSFYTTNEKGIAVLPIKESGEWMISLVKMDLLGDNAKADYERFWGSFTFYKK